MKPDRKRLLGGILVVLFCFALLIVLDPSLRLTRTFFELPPHEAQLLGFAVTMTIMITFAVLGYWLAKRRGRSPRKWMVVCFLLNVWGFIYLWSLPNLRGHVHE